MWQAETSFSFNVMQKSYTLGNIQCTGDWFVHPRHWGRQIVCTRAWCWFLLTNQYEYSSFRNAKSSEWWCAGLDWKKWDTTSNICSHPQKFMQKVKVNHSNVIMVPICLCRTRMLHQCECHCTVSTRSLHCKSARNADRFNALDKSIQSNHWV
jgi:hypothetical protein